MYTIERNSKYELVVKNSRFICLLYKINSEVDIKDILMQVRDEYKDATHYCYAYSVNGLKKASDDGEPAGTAGIPMLKVLDSNNLTNVLAIVIRYFGGIKLGANGLIRAYTKSVSNAIMENQLKELIDGINVNIIFNYNQVKDIDYLLRDIKINSKSFDDMIRYNVDIENSFLDKIIRCNIDYEIVRDIKIEK